MKEYKELVLAELNRLAGEKTEIWFSDAAKNLGFASHSFKAQDVLEIAKRFKKGNPDYKIFQDCDQVNWYDRLLFSENEYDTPEKED